LQGGCLASARPRRLVAQEHCNLFFLYYTNTNTQPLSQGYGRCFNLDGGSDDAPTDAQ
jgi:hypothetical protein